MDYSFHQPIVLFLNHGLTNLQPTAFNTLTHHNTMSYKEYYKEIKNELEEFSDVVYFEHLTEDEVLALENKIGVSIKPLFREYLLAFGFIQDIFDKVVTDLDEFLEDFEFIEATYKGYLPIYSEIGDKDKIYMINNTDLQDDFVYRAIINNSDKIGKAKKFKLFQELIEKPLLKLNNNHKRRCLNINKVNNTEFTFKEDAFVALGEIFKNDGFKQKTKWRPKYFPDNLFGTEVAIFNLFDFEFIVEWDEDDSQYFFELEEPILIEKEKSVISKIERSLMDHNIEYIILPKNQTTC